MVGNSIHLFVHWRASVTYLGRTLSLQKLIFQVVRYVTMCTARWAATVVEHSSQPPIEPT